MRTSVLTENWRKFSAIFIDLASILSLEELGLCFLIIALLCFFFSSGIFAADIHVSALS